MLSNSLVYRSCCRSNPTTKPRVSAFEKCRRDVDLSSEFSRPVQSAQMSSHADWFWRTQVNIKSTDAFMTSRVRSWSRSTSYAHRSLSGSVPTHQHNVWSKPHEGLAASWGVLKSRLGPVGLVWGSCSFAQDIYIVTRLYKCACNTVLDAVCCYICHVAFADHTCAWSTFCDVTCTFLDCTNLWILSWFDLHVRFPAAAVQGRIVKRLCCHEQLLVQLSTFHSFAAFVQLRFAFSFSRYKWQQTLADEEPSRTWRIYDHQLTHCVCCV